MNFNFLKNNKNIFLIHFLIAVFPIFLLMFIWILGGVYFFDLSDIWLPGLLSSVFFFIIILPVSFLISNSVILIGVGIILRLIMIYFFSIATLKKNIGKRIYYLHLLDVLVGFILFFISQQ